MFDDYLMKEQDIELWNGIENNDIKKVIKALSLNANVNSPRFGGSYETPLCAATDRHLTHLVKILLNYGANVCLTDKLGRTPLFLASVRGYADLLPLLVESNPAVLEIQTRSQNKALPYAAKENFTQVVKVLIDLGADVNAVSGPFQDTALMYAAYNNNREMIDILLKKGANLYAVNTKGNTPLQVAYKCGHYNTAAYLATLQETDLNTLKNGYAPLLNILKRLQKAKITPLFQEALIKEFIKAGALVTLFQPANKKTVYETLLCTVSPNLKAFLDESKEQEGKIADRAEKLIQNGKDQLSSFVNHDSLLDMRRTISILTQKLITKHQQNTICKKALLQNNRQCER